ncbi:MAG TPA: PIN domain-containing protein [Pyrinomonadaceae bacterium]|nr:PIN domain-containing protein [Pyrinomonadaceae bacterium]
MILVDTSVWVDHLRKGESLLAELLADGAVCVHPLVIEELACGNLPNRNEFLELIAALPAAVVAEHNEVLRLLDDEDLFGRGLGAVDVHLIASARLSFARLWSKDKAIRRETDRLRLTFPT